MSQAARRRVNLTISAAQLEEARHHQLNLSRVLEEALDARLREARARRWKEENREAIAHLNRRIEREGLWHRGLTPWH